MRHVTDLQANAGLEASSDGTGEFAFRISADREVRCHVGLASSSPVIGMPPPRPTQSGAMFIGLHEDCRPLDQGLSVSWQVQPASPDASPERQFALVLFAASSVEIEVVLGINLSSPIIGPPRPKQYGALSAVLDDEVELCVQYREGMLAESSVIIGPPPNDD